MHLLFTHSKNFSVCPVHRHIIAVESFTSVFYVIVPVRTRSGKSCETEVLINFVQYGTCGIFTNILYNYQDLLRQSNKSVSLFSIKGMIVYSGRYIILKVVISFQKLGNVTPLKLHIFIIFPKVLTPINPLTVVKIEAVILSLENLVVFSTGLLKERPPKISPAFSWISADLREKILLLQRCFYCNYGTLSL